MFEMEKPIRRQTSYSETRALLEESVDIPAYTEVIVQGKTDNELEDQDVLVEPGRGRDYASTNVPYTVCRVREGKVMFRIANISNKSVRLEVDEEIACVSPIVGVVSTSRPGATKSKRNSDMGQSEILEKVH